MIKDRVFRALALILAIVVLISVVPGHVLIFAVEPIGMQNMESSNPVVIRFITGGGTTIDGNHA